MITWGSLTLFNAGLLWALAGLPVLWFLLKFMPPPPRQIVIPTAHFLTGLAQARQTPETTPWWILLLRLLMLACLIIGYAHPVMHTSRLLSGSGPVLIVIDTHWSAAPVWAQQTQKAGDILTEAERANRSVYLLETAVRGGNNTPTLTGPISATEARAALERLKPWPWRADIGALLKTIEGANLKSDLEIFWLHSGLKHPGAEALQSALENHGSLTLIAPNSSAGIAVLRGLKQNKGGLSVSVDTLPSGGNQSAALTVQAIGDRGRILSQTQIKPKAGPQDITLDVPAPAKSELRHVRISGARHAGSVLVIPDAMRMKTAGILSLQTGQTEKPFIEAGYYLRRALEPFADVHTGPLHELLSSNPHLLVLSDIATLPPENIAALKEWVESGGVLLRFAGPAMAEAVNGDPLLPAPVIGGGRSLGGAVTWKEPLTLAPFPDDSPFAGLDVPQDMNVRRQLLTDPAMPDGAKVWASLSDGTPLVTARQDGQGLLVFVHTTASADWTDLPLTGLYVEILQRILTLSGHNLDQETDFKAATLEPTLTLDAFGNMQPPDAFVKPIVPENNQEIQPGPFHPPGLYGKTGGQIALSLAEHLPPLEIFGTAAEMSPAENAALKQTDLKPPLLLLALLLFALDWLIALMQAGGLFSASHLFKKAALAAICLLALAPSSQAADKDITLRYANGLYIAFIKSGAPDIDARTEKGLGNLVRILKDRTAIEPQGVVGVDLNTAIDINVFPLIFWPLTGDEKPLAQGTATLLQAYLDNGGTIVFDTRDRRPLSAFAAGPRQTALRRITDHLVIPPLAPLPADHVLKRSYYLLDRLDDTTPLDTLWIEDPTAGAHRDGVSSVIISAADYASLWASANMDDEFITLPSDQEEAAFRFGVNLVLYTLTGNYKADQVHVPHILERLNQTPLQLSPEDLP